MSEDGHGAWPAARVPPALRWVAWLCALGAAWIILPAQTAAWTFLGELMVHWTAHAVVLLVVPLVIWRRLRAHCLGVLALLALGLWPWLAAAWSPRCPPIVDADLTVAAFNLFVINPHRAADIPALRSCQADVLVLIEADPTDEQALRGDPRWPYQRWVADGTIVDRAVMIAVLSRHPVSGFELHELEGNIAIEARMICAGQPLHVLAFHSRAPVSPSGWLERGQQFERLASLVRLLKGPVVVLGDLNCTVASPAWRRLLRESGLRRAGGNAPATWPAQLGPFGIAIDHVLAGNGARVGDVRSVGLAGSDHRGITAAVSVR